jgi:hypothetical protein
MWLSAAAGSDTEQVKLLADEVAAGAILSHPRHQAAQQSLAELIEQLRAARNIEDGYEVQQALLERRLEADDTYFVYRRAAMRVRAGKQPQPGVPEPQSGMDPAMPEAWELERDLSERIGRQYRCIGDALAWRVFGFQRKQIIALSQSDPPGPMARKKGLAAELAELEQARAEGRFAILHDLTNCLRIGDVTVFGDDGTATTIEVKSDPNRRSPAQNRKIKAALAAVRDNAPLPGQDPRIRLYDLDLPFKTHLDVLCLGTMRADRDGIFAARIPGGRALIVADMYGCSKQGWTDDEFAAGLESKRNAALRRAGISGDPQWLVTATSLDLVSRDPLRVPFAAYPLHPVACARIIGDLAAFFVITSGPILADSVRRAGIEARWVRPAAAGDLTPGEVVMEMVTRTSAPVPPALAEQLHRRDLRLEYSRTLQMRRSELDMYLIQLLDQDTWLQGVRYMLADPDLKGRPWPHYRDEDQVWL